jgi:hypothetical protein
MKPRQTARCDRAPAQRGAWPVDLAWPWAFPFRVTALTALKARLSRAVAREGVAKFLKRQTARLLNRANDRAQTLRLAKRRWHPDGRPVFLLINHRHGGGTEQHVVDLRARLSGEGIRVVLARPGRRQRVLWEERDENQRLLWRRESTCDRDSMSRTLADLKPAHAHVHHVLGIPLGLIDRLDRSRLLRDLPAHQPGQCRERVLWRTRRRRLQPLPGSAW